MDHFYILQLLCWRVLPKTPRDFWFQRAGAKPPRIVFFREIVDFMQRNEAAWRKWYDENEPESVPIPDYDERINMDRTGWHCLTGAQRSEWGNDL